MIAKKRRLGADGWKYHPPRVTEIRDGSPCKGHVKQGDLLLMIDGRAPLDVLDYLETSASKRVYLRLSRKGHELQVDLEKEAGIPLGLVFDEAVFDGVRTCRNRCIFCFIDQMPPGMRSTLYIKDDDYRLSFYYGNFITLNNLSQEDLRRIIRMRIAPLYVSLHTTDAALRSYLMGGNASRGLEALEALLQEGLEIHLQVVVCPGINDGQALRRTLEDVLYIFQASSLGVVPLGSTSRVSSLPHKLKPHDRGSSLEVLQIVDEFQLRALEKSGERIFFAADEFFIMAGRDFPPAEVYGKYPQLENGVGMARKFIDEVREAVRERRVHPKHGRGVLTGVAGAVVMRDVVDSVFAGDNIELVVIGNELFGPSVTVTSLLGGRDIINGLRQVRISSDELLISESLLRDGRFIDDLTIEDVLKQTGVILVPVEVDGSSFVGALCGGIGE